MGDVEKSNDYHRKALEIRRENVGPNHVNRTGYFNEFDVVANSGPARACVSQYDGRNSNVKIFYYCTTFLK